jgi:hypothetical protein
MVRKGPLDSGRGAVAVAVSLLRGVMTDHAPAEALVAGDSGTHMPDDGNHDSDAENDADDDEGGSHFASFLAPIPGGMLPSPRDFTQAPLRALNPAAMT